MQSGCISQAVNSHGDGHCYPSVILWGHFCGWTFLSIISMIKIFYVSLFYVRLREDDIQDKLRVAHQWTPSCSDLSHLSPGSPVGSGLSYSPSQPVCSSSWQTTQRNRLKPSKNLNIVCRSLIMMKKSMFRWEPFWNSRFSGSQKYSTPLKVITIFWITNQSVLLLQTLCCSMV